MNDNSTELDLSLSRRTILKAGLASAALLLVQGCSVFGSSDELDEAFAQLRSKLLDLEKNTDQESRLIKISKDIEQSCQQMTDEHNQFRASFENSLNDRKVSNDELENLINDFKYRRNKHRDALFAHQDALRAELSEEEWQRVSKSLNQAGKAYTRPTIGES
jgi:septal ring factor EnvC (AmiA/AmiB activator)